MSARRCAHGLRARWRLARQATRRYREVFGRRPRLLLALNHSERLHRVKVLRRDPRHALLADKVEAKAWIASRVGEEYVIPTLYAGRRLPRRRRRRTWPRPLFVKAAHGSGKAWNVRVPADGPARWGRVERKVHTWLTTSYGGKGGEWHYGAMPRRVLVEPHIGDPERLPDDYQLWVFHGRVHFVQWHTDRGTPSFGVRYVDRDWTEAFRSTKFRLHERMPPKPQSWDTMVWIAETLGRDFPFVRVDLYEVDGHPYVGELTFTPTAGFHRFEPPETDRMLGRLWRKPRVPRHPATPRPEVARAEARVGSARG